MSESQAIPWKRLSAEGVAIVVSILLAFWIDAWWGTQKDIAEEREILVGLEAEFVDLSARLDGLSKMNREGTVLIDNYLSDSVVEMSPISVEQLFVFAYYVNVLDQGGALDALLASGRLEKVAARDIRARLAKWPDWLEDMHTNDLSFRDYAFREILPFLTGHGIPKAVCADGEIWCSQSGSISPIYLELANDPEWRAMLIIRRGTMLISAVDQESAISESDQLLAMIRIRLDEIGR